MEKQCKRGELLGQAILIATTAHAGQYDKGGARVRNPIS